MFSNLSRRCPLLATFLSVLFCLLSMLISDSRFDLVWFRLSCDHGWIRSGSVNVRNNNNNNNMRTRRPVHASRPVTAGSVHAAHVDYGHNAQPVHDNNAYARPAGPHQSPAAPPPPHTHVPHTAGPTETTPTNTLHSTNPRGRAGFPGPRNTGN